MKTSHWIVIGLAVGAGAYWYSQKNGPLLPYSNKGFNPQSGSSDELSKGDSGNEVRKLQEWLISKGGEPARLINQSGGADGIFGSGTQAALVAATGQSSIGLDEFPSGGENTSFAALEPKNEVTQDDPANPFWQFTL